MCWKSDLQLQMCFLEDLEPGWRSLTGRNRPLGWVPLGAVSYPSPSPSPIFPALFSSEHSYITLSVSILKWPFLRQLHLEKPGHKPPASIQAALSVPVSPHLRTFCVFSLQTLSQGGSLRSFLCSSPVQQLNIAQEVWGTASLSSTLPLSHLIIYKASPAREVT